MILTLRIIIAIISCAIGIAGLILPILPGWLFFLLAFAVLAPQHRYTKSAVVWVEKRAPRMAKTIRWMGMG
jgi:uncharacterized membrane protein YbaN (DUF454 family)